MNSQQIPLATQDKPLPGFIPGDLAWHLGMILRGHQTLFAQAVEEIPCSVRGYQMLSTVVHHDPANQQALGAHLGIDRTVLTYLIDDLVTAELVDRIPAPTDRRARKIIATPKGLELLQRLETRVAQAEQTLLTGLDSAETSALAGLLGKLSMSVHSSQPGANPCEAMDHLG
ncbi:MarR family winged helix-turn-helix transcriptional regulator [Arthrobacter sp. MYb227]|uniref:MarR family winged helix-turn-helix transcriptional regulator n=1 Tax=Arthrobacter sp. MYb227 TaxID=1848601 RepID=UPI0015E2EF9A|nr:MarR family transcriptional regulator [Arthrobacter sp. MYb227]